MLLFTTSCSFANPVKNMAKKIKLMNIASYEIKWLMRIDEPYTHSEYKLIYESGNKGDIKLIKNSMDNIHPNGGSAFTSIRQKAQGILLLKDKSSNSIQIDISDIGFFVGSNRAENALFYSNELSKIIEEIILKFEHKDKLLLTDTFFKRLSNSEN